MTHFIRVNLSPHRESSYICIPSHVSKLLSQLRGFFPFCLVSLRLSTPNSLKTERSLSQLISFISKYGSRDHRRGIAKGSREPQRYSLCMHLAEQIVRRYSKFRLPGNLGDASRRWLQDNCDQADRVLRSIKPRFQIGNYPMRENSLFLPKNPTRHEIEIQYRNMKKPSSPHSINSHQLSETGSRFKHHAYTISPQKPTHRSTPTSPPPWT